MLDNLVYEYYCRDLRQPDMTGIHLRVMNLTYKSGGPKGARQKDMRTNMRVAKSSWLGNARHRFGPWLSGDDEVTHSRNEILKATLDKMDEIYHKIKKRTGREPYASEIIKFFEEGFADRPRRKLLEYIPDYVIANGLDENTARVYNKNIVAALQKFLELTYKTTDMYLDELETSFVYRFEMWLASANSRYGKPYSKSTATEYMNKLKAIITHANKTGETDTNVVDKYIPTNALKPDKATKVVETFKDAVTWKIDPQDLHKIETVQIAGKALRDEDLEASEMFRSNINLVRVRLLFLLQSWTGFAYADLEKYRSIKSIIRLDLTGKESIIYNRAKTGELAIVPMFEQTKTILEALDYNISPLSSYETYNRQIKALFRYYNITMADEKEGSTHVGRHLFGSRMLTMNFSMEAISRMMGHASISETEKVYARIDFTKINADLDRIKITEQLGHRIAI